MAVVSLTRTFPSGPMPTPCYCHHHRIWGIPDRTPEDQWGCSCHLSPIPHLVEGKSLYHHPLVRVLTDGKGPLGLQKVVDLLIVHLGRREARERPEGQFLAGTLSPGGWARAELLGRESMMGLPPPRVAFCGWY